MLHCVWVLRLDGFFSPAPRLQPRCKGQKECQMQYGFYPLVSKATLMRTEPLEKIGTSTMRIGGFVNSFTNPE
jgi:hypothetical protein